MTEIYRNDLIYSLSYALDFVERDVVMVSGHHSKRVAYLAATLGRESGYSGETLLNLAACGALHDNAMSEYQHKRMQEAKTLTPEHLLPDPSFHCTVGEQNISQLSFYDSVQGSILYHHENADGSGPFHKTAREVPVYARLIHIADAVDARFDLSEMTEEKFQTVHAFVRGETGKLFDPDTAAVFARRFSTADQMRLDLDALDQRLREELPEVRTAYQPQQLIRLASLFSKIIDYKSPFTCRHSSGIAEKAQRMGAFYGWDEDVQSQLYLAGAVHDVGKLMIRSDVLEKPGKLTEDEYRHVQNHAYGSYVVLHDIRGMEEISRWAYLHHEKLDGSGYPFGKTGAELNRKERLMVCLDIYQALREARPYKAGYAHGKAMAILRKMAGDGLIDRQIVEDLDVCFQDLAQEEEIAPVPLFS